MSAITVIKKGKYFSGAGRTIIVGRRSWIAPHLFKELESRGRRPEYMMKAEVGDERLDGAVMYLIAGVASPTQKEMDREVDLCERAASTGAQLKYLSSCAVDRWEAESRVLSEAGELYVLGKRRCETIVTGGPSGCGYALRAPITFGPGQRLESEMLLPTIIRHVGESLGAITLHDPFRKIQMVHVADLVRAWADQAELDDAYPVTSLHTEPEISPIELANLAAPGWPVYIPHGWTFQTGKELSDRTAIYHTRRKVVPFRREDVVSTVRWYIDEDPQLIGPGTLLLEG